MILKIIATFIYWIIFGWWLEPIRYFKRRKIEKMQNEITKHEYEKIQQEKRKN